MEPFGSIPAWSAKPLLKPKLIQPWRKRPKKRLSDFGRRLMERQRLRFHYNVRNDELVRYFSKSWKKGIERPMEQFFQTLESRLDNFVWRSGLAPTMPAARNFILNGHIQYMPPNKDGSYNTERYHEGWITNITPGCLLKVGTKIRVKHRPTSQGVGRKALDAEPDVTLPDHITFDRESMEGMYKDVCDPEQLGIIADEDLIFSGFSDKRQRLAPKGRARLHQRYFPGTYKEICGHYNGGRIKPTPENIANMKLGAGLHRSGRRKPPCQWGRPFNKPLNNPYDENVPKRPWWKLKVFPPPQFRKNVKPYAIDTVPGRYGHSGRK